MAPKRSRAREGGGDEQEYDSIRFAHPSAEEASQTFRKRPLVEERGLVNDQPFIGAYVERFGWQKLIRAPVSAVKALVKEFYVNYPHRTGNKVLVRGKQVRVSATTINRFYELQNLENDEYLAIAHAEEHDWEAIMATMVKPGVELSLMPNWSHLA